MSDHGSVFVTRAWANFGVENKTGQRKQPTFGDVNTGLSDCLCLL